MPTMKSVLLGDCRMRRLRHAVGADPLKLAPVAITPSDDILSPGLAERPVAEGRSSWRTRPSISCTTAMATTAR